ncbi:hypothetical protein [Shouchella lonarensis]|uniref:Competence protein ComGG n=1 Tax=Shouchella lonarensis TaxID=1464122 RepID=A0A1G6GM45_9BACI|nr:hypothetical protein [Shouchella lonarensis]SDB83060.1 hypothetical protein SAMN05421737_101246 [Shouchella lonarensis]
MWKNEQGAVLPLTLCVLLLVSVFFSYQLYTYERKSTFVAHQSDQLMLDNLLQLGLSFALEEENMSPLIVSHGEVYYEFADDEILISAQLQNGAKRVATAVVDEGGKLLRYRQGEGKD